jgi:hypothetical protein
MRVFAKLGTIEFAFEQLRRATQGAERILDLVREIAHQFAIGLALVEQALLAGNPQLLLDGGELEHEAAALGQIFRCHGAGEQELLHLVARGHHECQVVLGEAAAIPLRERHGGVECSALGEHVV